MSGLHMAPLASTWDCDRGRYRHRDRYLVADLAGTDVESCDKGALAARPVGAGAHAAGQCACDRHDARAAVCAAAICSALSR